MKKYVLIEATYRHMMGVLKTAKQHAESFASTPTHGKVLEGIKKAIEDLKSAEEWELKE